MKFKKEDIWQVKRNMFKGKDWLSKKTKKKDLKCSNCNTPFTNESKIALMSFNDLSKNTHLCDVCAKAYIELGAIDINEIEKKNIQEKKELLKQIKDNYILMDYSNQEIKRLLKGFSTYKKVELQVELKETEKETARYLQLKAIDPRTWSILEDYLIEQYSVIEDKYSLKSTDQIENYFTDVGPDYFECGQGFYNLKQEVIVHIANKFYLVTIHADIGSSKQNVGDRLYWVDCISKVEYKEIDKPKKKLKEKKNYQIKLTEIEQKKLEAYLLDLKIEFKLQSS